MIYKTCVYWIAVNIAAYMQEITVFIDVNSFEAFFKKCARSIVHIVKCLCVAVENCLHEIANLMVAILA